MIIKEKTVQEDTNKVYEVYEEGTATTPDGKEVVVLNLKRTVSLDELNSEIAMLENEIASATERKTKLEEIKAQIEGEE